MLMGAIWAVPGLTVHAQERPFGAGIVLGSPSGLTGKYWLRQARAIDGGLAWSERRDAQFLIYGDLLFHRFDLLDEERTALYYGIGGHLVLEGDAGLGVRVPLGITHLFRAEPIGIFLELIPVLRLAPETGFDVHGGIGASFYFARS
jgi:hypothetical protein